MTPRCGTGRTQSLPSSLRTLAADNPGSFSGAKLKQSLGDMLCSESEELERLPGLSRQPKAVFDPNHVQQDRGNLKSGI
jgi:hypothetical protein